MKHLIQRSLKQFGLEIRQTAHNRNLMDFINDRKIDVVVDVGANVGQFGQELRAKGYRGKIVSFEPVSAVFETLAATTAADDNWDVNNCGLGPQCGQAAINVADSSVFSSILPSTRAATVFTETAAVTRTETIEVRTLDDVSPALSGNILLKIDTQGFERQVLEGGRSSLPMMKGVLMELPIVHLYEGTWKFHEAVEFMDEAGFVPAQIHPVNFHGIDSVSLLEVDCLFRPRNQHVD